MYLFPIPARPLRSLLDSKAGAGAEFSEDEATADLMLMLDRGKEMSLRELAARWGWSRMTTSRRLPEIREQVASWRAWNNTSLEVGQRGTEVGQRGTQNASNNSENAGVGTGVGQRGTEVGQPDLIYPRAPKLDITTKLDNTPTARPSHVEKRDRIPFDEVMQSWNDFAAPLGLPTIRSLNDKRRAGIRRRYAKVWPNIAEVYQRISASSFLTGGGPRGWRVHFEFIWCSSDGTDKILEGNYDDGERSTADQAPLAERTGSEGSGIPIYDLAASAGREVPGGVSARRNGGPQPPGRRQGAFKRPGERSYREHLEASGYTPAEIRALEASGSFDDGAPGSADSGGGDAETPYRPLLRLRA